MLYAVGTSPAFFTGCISEIKVRLFDSREAALGRAKDWAKASPGRLFHVWEVNCSVQVKVPEPEIIYPGLDKVTCP